MTSRLEQLEASAAAGDAEAMTDLALVYARGEEMQGVDAAKAVAWYQKAVGLGNCRAMGNLAYLYLNGISVPKDPVRAVGLYGEAVKGDFPDVGQCLYDLAGCYEAGEGVPRDVGRAAALYRKACARGFGLARKALVRLGA